jgi:hypothetical protein
MRVVVLCVALSCWAPVAAAQVSFVRREPEDERVARALEKLIDEPVLLVDAAAAGRDDAATGARITVSIDHQRGMLRVVTPSAPAGLMRRLDPTLLASSPYAVALAAAELLELSSVETRPAERLEPVKAAGRGVGEVPRTTADARPLVAAARSPASSRAEVAPEDDRPETEPRASDVEKSPERVDRVQEAPAAPERIARPEQASASAVEDRSEQPSSLDRVDDRRVSPEPAYPHALRSGGLPDYAIGADLELQSQPGYALAFVRPAISAELAWGRDTAGAFWTAGARVCAPLGRDLQPLGAGAAAGSSVRAQAMDAALQTTLGYAFGRLALTTQLAAGLSYLRVEALDAERHALGHDTQLSPLLAAGLGARLSVALGFALAVRGEVQWAGPGARYDIRGIPVLEGGPFRVGVIGGVLWESALGRAGL